MKVLDEVGKFDPFIQGMLEPISLHKRRKSDRTSIYILSGSFANTARSSPSPCCDRY